MLQNTDPSTFSKIVYARWQKENGTKVVLCENVVTGNVQKRCAETFSAGSMYDIKTIHVCSEDTGYGAIKRYRGWNLGLFLDVPPGSLT